MTQHEMMIWANHILTPTYMTEKRENQTANSEFEAKDAQREALEIDLGLYMRDQIQVYEKSGQSEL